MFTYPHIKLNIHHYHYHYHHHHYHHYHYSSSTICQPDKPHNLSAANNNEDTPPAVFVVDYSTVFSNRGYGIEPTTAPMAPSTSIAPIPMVLATPVANRMPAEIAWTGVNTLAKGEDPVGAHKYLPTYQEALIANRDQLMG